MKRKTSRQVRGGGYSVSPANMISPGNVVYSQYSGAGKDCVAEPAPSVLSRLTSMFGGKRRSQRRSYGKRRGGYSLEVASVPLPGEIGTPAAAQAPSVSAPAIPAHAQKGGRYESNMTHLLDSHGDIGMSSYAPIQRIPCEHSRHMSGGFQAADMMQVRAPTAGYGHGYELSGNGGLMTTAPYEARASNPACHTTGGKRRSYGKRRTKKRSTKKQQKKSRKQRK